MAKRRWILALGMVLLGGAGVSCSPKSAPRPTLHLAVWANYLAPETIAEFTRQSGIEVQVSNYSSNEELLAKLQAGGGGYDVAVPTDYMVFAMIQLGLLEPLDRSRIPGIANLDPRFMGRASDRTNRFSLPIHWGTTGIARNKKLFPGPIRAWKELLGRTDLKGKFTLLDDARETLGAALRAQGHSINTRKADELAQAQSLLAQARLRVKGFSTETKVPLIQGEVALAQAYSSDALQAAAATGGTVEYFIPEEGGTLWVDNLVVPKGARNVAAAHAFIDFLLKPEIASRTVATLWLGTANREALKHLPEAVRSNPGLFPSEAVLRRLEGMEDLGAATAQYDRAWSEVKAGVR